MVTRTMDFVASGTLVFVKWRGFREIIGLQEEILKLKVLYFLFLKKEEFKL